MKTQGGGSMGRDRVELVGNNTWVLGAGAYYTQEPARRGQRPPAAELAVAAGAAAAGAAAAGAAAGAGAGAAAGAGGHGYELYHIGKDIIQVSLSSPPYQWTELIPYREYEFQLTKIGVGRTWNKWSGEDATRLIFIVKSPTEYKLLSIVPDSAEVKAYPLQNNSITVVGDPTALTDRTNRTSERNIVQINVAGQGYILSTRYHQLFPDTLRLYIPAIMFNDEDMRIRSFGAAILNSPASPQRAEDVDAARATRAAAKLALDAAVAEEDVREATQAVAEATAKLNKKVLLDTLQRFDVDYMEATKDSSRSKYARALEAAKSQEAILRNRVAGQKITVSPSDWGEAARILTKAYGTTFACLNMANELHFGGGYTRGDKAQEENMFRRTNCHFCDHRLMPGQPPNIKDDITVAQKAYADTYLQRSSKCIDVIGNYTEDYQNFIQGAAPDNFIQGTLDTCYLDPCPRLCIKGPDTTDEHAYNLLEEPFLFYELRSAAPDLRRGNGWHAGVNEDGVDEVKEALDKRIQSQLKTLKAHDIKHVVLSAFGCGAFLNDPVSVAGIYKEHLELPEYKDYFECVNFAIYYPGYGPDNYTPFREILTPIKYDWFWMGDEESDGWVRYEPRICDMLNMALNDGLTDQVDIGGGRRVVGLTSDQWMKDDTVDIPDESILRQVIISQPSRWRAVKRSPRADDPVQTALVEGAAAAESLEPGSLEPEPGPPE